MEAGSRRGAAPPRSLNERPGGAAAPPPHGPAPSAGDGTRPLLRCRGRSRAFRQLRGPAGSRHGPGAVPVPASLSLSGRTAPRSISPAPGRGSAREPHPPERAARRSRRRSGWVQHLGPGTGAGAGRQPRLSAAGPPRCAPPARSPCPALDAGGRRRSPRPRRESGFFMGPSAQPELSPSAGDCRLSRGVCQTHRGFQPPSAQNPSREGRTGSFGELDSPKTFPTRATMNTTM